LSCWSEDLLPLRASARRNSESDLAILLRPSRPLGELDLRGAIAAPAERSAMADYVAHARTQGAGGGLALALRVHHRPHRLLEGEPTAEADDAPLAERVPPEIFRPHTATALAIPHRADGRHDRGGLENEPSATAHTLEGQTGVRLHAAEAVAVDRLRTGDHEGHRRGRGTAGGLPGGEDDRGLDAHDLGDRLGRDLRLASLDDLGDTGLEGTRVAEEPIDAEARELLRRLTLPAEDLADLAVAGEVRELVGGLARGDDHREVIRAERVAVGSDERVGREAEVPDKLVVLDDLDRLGELGVAIRVDRLADGVVGRLAPLVADVAKRLPLGARAEGGADAGGGAH